jgi:WD40 repeat protein
LIILQGAKERVEQLYFAPGSLTLFVPARSSVQVWPDFHVAHESYSIPFPDTRSIQFCQDGKTVLLVGSSVAVRDITTGRTVRVSYPPPYTTTSDVSVLPGGVCFLSSQSSLLEQPRGRLVYRALADPAADIWSVSTSRHFQSPPLFLPGRDRFVIIEWWNGETGHEYGPAFVTRDVTNGEALSEVRASGRGHANPISFAITSADRRLVAARTGRWIGVYRSEDFTTAPVLLQIGGKKDITGLAFHPSGQYLAATSNDELVTLFDTTTWSIARQWDWGIGRLRSVAFTWDGLVGAVGGDKGQVVLFDVDL